MFFDHFNTLCIKANMSPTQFVTEILHLSSSKVTAWKNGSIPKYGILNEIASYFNVSIGYLFDGERDQSSNNLSKSEQELIAVYNQLSPLSKGRVLERAKVLLEQESEKEEKQQERTLTITSSEYRVSAGCGVLLDEESPTEITVPDTPEARKADFALTICGDSMEPIYHDGDVVLVRKMPSVEIGEIGIFYVDGGGYIKKYGGDRLISLNSAYDDILLNENTEIRCFGKVIGRA